MAKGFARVRDRDRGFKHLKRQLKIGKIGLNITIGVNEEEGLEKSSKSSDITVAEIAFIHEFGLSEKNIPARSFLRSTADETGNFKSAINKLFEEIVIKKLGLIRAMELLGLKIESKIKQKIRAGIIPALKEATVKRKGSTKPLIDTGQLLRSIKARVNK